ncbi:efflux transporter outer membrane subunit [Verminephrobacter eiseniae]|uniref:RND efflux system, outer membrane lipoprotein, NodT family n=1 Tax=Verminephrobacter eiseniae (strain EF01-2) TaxID=391735 RepID=A1WK45_VEREI|nr:RND efflux system, outer membrane lipoprotein, NodT family [Verminephrobacter eiseniae EF01-2]
MIERRQSIAATAAIAATRTLPLRLCAVALLMTQAGCSVMTTAYERPAAPVPASYALAAADAPQGAASLLPWQDYFADPRLRQLLDIALTNNRDLRVAMLNVEQTRAQFQLRRADLYPGVDLNAKASRARATDGKPNPSFGLGLAVTAWEIDFFGRIARLKDQALAQYLASQEGRNAAQLSLVASVANGWLNLLADEELLGLSRQTLASRESSARLTRMRLDAGVVSELDWRQAESLTQDARATLAQQQRQRAVDENALALLLGQALPDDIRASLARSRLADAPALVPLPAGLPSELLTRRPDIRQAEQQLIAAKASMDAARAAFFPHITLTAQAGTASDALSGLFHGGSWGFSIAPSLLLALFDAGRNQAQLEVSEAVRSIAVAQYEKAIQTAFREVSDALAGQATLGEQVQARQNQAQAEAASLRLAELRYLNGVASHLDLLDAQRSLFSTQQAVVQTRLAQLQNQVTLYKALGGGAPDTVAKAPS